MSETNVEPILALRSRIVESVKQHQQQLAILKAQLQGVDQALSAMGVHLPPQSLNGAAVVPPPEPPDRGKPAPKRGKHVAKFVFKLLDDTPRPGLKVDEILRKLADGGHAIKAQSLRSFLSTNTTKGKLVRTDGRYSIAPEAA